MRFAPDDREPPTIRAAARGDAEPTRPAAGEGGVHEAATALPATVRPFDPSSLPAVTAAEARRLDGAAARVRPARLASFARALGEVLGEAVRLEALGVATLGSAGATAPKGLGVRLERPVPRAGERVVVAIGPALAARAAARALRREPPELTRPAAASGDAADGAAAAVLAAALARLDGAPSWVADVGDAAALAPAEGVRVDLAVHVGGVAHAAALLLGGVRSDGVRASTTAPRPRGATCTLHAIVAWGALPRAALEGLAEGDVVLPGARVDAGEVRLAGARATQALTARVGPDGSLVLGSRSVAMLPTTPPDAPDADAADLPGVDALDDALAQADVHVRVELGQVSLSAGEWSALVPGQIVALDRRAADGVVLRAGGRAVARGELVTVDGELGVRVLALGGAS